jgi:mycothiol synthase
MNVRPASPDDFGAVAKLFGSVEEAIYGRPSHLDAEAIDGWMQTTNLETNSWLVEENEVLVAGAFSEVHEPRGIFAGAVHPSAQGRGLGTQLAELAEARLTDEGAERIHAYAVGGDKAADDLFLGRGYQEVRRFWDLAIELDHEIPEPLIEIETFREEDAPAYHAALEEAFADHWEHRPESFDEWWSRQQARPGYDPSLWFLISDGGEIAGVVRNDPNRLGGGYVGALGVRRAWRGRGYGRALLRHTFREFRRRGMWRASLGVDASNPTGATQLYESVGMHVEMESVVWEKLLDRDN